MRLKDIRDFRAEKGEAVISPSILAADFARLGEAAAAAEAGGADMLHLDVMDGHQVPNISFGVPVIKSLRKCSGMFFDTHLMISEPLRYVEAFRNAGSDLITFHLESDNDPLDVIRAIRSSGAAVGMSICPGTPAEELFRYLKLIDLVLIMSVEPGFGGQKFMAEVLLKVEKLRSVIPHENPDLLIEIDGGIDRNTAPLAKKAGCDILVAGSSVFGSPDGVAAAVKALR